MKPCKVKIVDRPFGKEHEFSLEVDGERVDWPILSYQIGHGIGGAPKLFLEVWVDEVEVDGEVELHPLLKPASNMGDCPEKRAVFNHPLPKDGSTRVDGDD